MSTAPTPMTRERALLTLLAVGPCSRAELPLITGWGIGPTLQLLDELHQRGLVTYWNGAGAKWYQITGHGALA